MAAYHVRSNSFPSKQHPLIPEFDQQLRRLSSSQEASSSSVASKFNGLQDLHDCVDRLLMLPLNQQALSKEQNKNLVDELLDGSLRILDLCDTAKIALTQSKESAHEILSILRRRRGDDLAAELKKFSSSRKLAKKALNKVKSNVSSSAKESVEIVGMLRDVESITLTVFESMFSFISGPKSQNSLLAKLTNSKKVACEEVNEFESVEAALKMLVSQKAKKLENRIEVSTQNQIQKLEMCIQDLEEGVESLYRRLIKTRVSLLNILNH